MIATPIGPARLIYASELYAQIEESYMWAGSLDDPDTLCNMPFLLYQALPADDSSIVIAWVQRGDDPPEPTVPPVDAFELLLYDAQEVWIASAWDHDA